MLKLDTVIRNMNTYKQETQVCANAATESILKQESMLNCVRHWGIIAVMCFIGPGRDQEEVAKVAPAEIHEVGHQIPAPVYRQQ